jgi:hypothetical protein
MVLTHGLAPIFHMARSADRRIRIVSIILICLLTGWHAFEFIPTL